MIAQAPIQVLNSDESILDKGQSLAPVFTAYSVQHLLIGITEYPLPIETGRWHAHTNPMISFVLEGGNIENRKQKQLERTSGSINFYHSYEPHQNIYQKFPSKHLSIEIDKKFLEEYGISEFQVCKAVESSPFSKFLFLNILNEVLLNNLFTDSSVTMLFLELLNKNTDVKLISDTPNWVSDLKGFIHENWNRQLSLQDLSDQIGIHPVTISGNFRAYFSSTFGEYMRKLKVERSLSMIRESGRSLSQIAYDCGFSDQSHFTRIFKRQTGFLPSQYQKV